MPRIPAQEITNPLCTVGRNIGRTGWNPNRRCRQPDDGVERQVPRQSDGDHREHDRGGDGEVLPSFRRLQTVENRPDLQTDEDERENVQRKDDGLPDGISWDANACRRPLWRRARVRL